jgi:hypothetical protein
MGSKDNLSRFLHKLIFFFTKVQHNQKTMTSFTTTPPRKTTVYFTDPDNEIDDQVLLHIVLQRDTKDQDIYFVCVPGFSTSDEISPIQQAKYRVECVRTQFPEQFGEKDVYTPEIADHPNASTFYLLTWYDFLKSLESQSSVFQVDTLVQVAPLIHMVPEHLNVLEIQTRIVMGDLMNPDNSMNLTKSMSKDTAEGKQLRSLYAQQEEILYKHSTKNISIPTLYARQIPIPYALMESLPDTLRTPLLDKAFEQFVGRVDPALPWAESISVANHATILKMLSKNKMYDVLTQPTDPRLITMVEEFLPFMVPCDHLYYLRLCQMATAVEHIIQVKYKTSGFNHEALEDASTAKENWLTYLAEHRPDMTPLYDGIAWVVMQKGELPSVEECKTILYNALT